MAKIYNLADRLVTANQKPTIEIDADHIYKINTSTAAALMIESIAGDGTLGEIERSQKIVTIALGKDAADYLDGLELTMTAFSLIVNSVMAAIADMTLEELEASMEGDRFQEKKTRKK